MTRCVGCVCWICVGCLFVLRGFVLIVLVICVLYVVLRVCFGFDCVLFTWL